MPGRRLKPGFIIGVAIITASIGQSAFATQLILRSTKPYWDVGERDDNLSLLCSTGRFNEASVNAFVARFDGEDGKAVLGIAKGSGVNLYDPGHNAKPKEDYFFLGDGSSSCTVFVGGRPKKPPPKPPGTPGAAGTAAAGANAAGIAVPQAPSVAPPTPPAGAPPQP